MRIREFTFVPEDKDKPIKMVYEDDFKVIQTSDCTIEIVRRLTPMESEKLLRDMFGTTDVGILDCGDMTDEEFEDIVEKFNSIPEVYPISANNLNKVLERYENEEYNT